MTPVSDDIFERFLNEQWVRRGRLVGIIGIGFGLLLMGYDYLLYPGTFQETTSIRIFQFAAIFALLAVSFVERWWHLARIYVTLGVVVFIAGVDMIFHIQGTQAAPDRVFAYTATTFVVFYLLPIGKWEGSIYLLTTYAGFAIAGWAFGFPPPTFSVPYLTQAAVTVAVGVIGNSVFYRTKREEIAANLALEYRSEQLAEAKVELEATLAELRASQAALTRAEGLAAVSEFVNGIAHEINNPLASARSLLETLDDDIVHVHQNGLGSVPEDELRMTVIAVRGEIDRARTLIREVRSLSEEIQKSPDHVDLSLLLREVINEIRTGPHANLNLELRQDGAVQPLKVRAHYARLRRVFLNLLDNAIDAEKKAGHEPSITVSLQPSGNGVSVVVEDHGIGIDPAIREKIFQPFFTTRRGEHRPGLGLYIAHEIVRSLGGQIAVDSNPGSGSRFSVTLPAGQAAA